MVDWDNVRLNKVILVISLKGFRRIQENNFLGSIRFRKREETSSLLQLLI